MEIAVVVKELDARRCAVADPDRAPAKRVCRTWALLDPLAIGVVGVLVERKPPAWDPVVRPRCRPHAYTRSKSLPMVLTLRAVTLRCNVRSR